MCGENEIMNEASALDMPCEVDTSLLTDTDTVADEQTVDEVNDDTSDTNTTADETSSKKENNKDNGKKKVVDSALGFDYTYLLNRDNADTKVISDEEIADEDNALIKAFLEANADVECYIDKAIFDPTAKVATHIINKCKDPKYTITIGDKEYRLAHAIMLSAMAECYTYVQSVAKELAQMTSNSGCIQLDDEAVYTIAENFFKLGGKRPSVRTEGGKKSVTSKTKTTKVGKKSATVKAEPKKAETKAEPNLAQISFFDNM